MQRHGYDTGHTEEMWKLQRKTLDQMNVIVATAKAICVKHRDSHLV